MSVFEIAKTRNHEQVVFFNYPQFGLKAIIAIHDTTLGPALGGCRMRAYKTEEEAVDDVMRLSEGMTYKSAMAELPLGGGKACIIADPHMKQGRQQMFEQLGRCLNMLGGRYITAEDMGTSVEDIMNIRKYSKYAAGFAKEEGGGGDPSPWTALGVYGGIISACEIKYGSKDLKGKKIALQGIGHVGMYLLEHLTKAGAECTVCDFNHSVLEIATQKHGAKVVDPSKIYDVNCDIFSPNAIGQTVNADTLSRLNCGIIAGAANNQLISSDVYELINNKNILYCPDFIINAGGIISVGAEYNEGGWKESWVRAKAENIQNTVKRVLEESIKTNEFPEITAERLAKEKVESAKRRME